MSFEKEISILKNKFHNTNNCRVWEQVKNTSHDRNKVSIGYDWVKCVKKRNSLYKLGPSEDFETHFRLSS